MAIPKSGGNRPISSLITIFRSQHRPDSSAAKSLIRLVKLIKQRSSDGTLKLDEALGYFDSLNQLRPIPPATVFNQLLNSVSKMNHHFAAVSLYRELMFLGFARFRPDFRTLSIVTRSVCNLKKSELGFSVLGIMLKNGLAFNVHTLNNLLHGLCSQGLLVEACDLLMEIMERDYPCNSVTFGIMINGFCKAGAIGKGFDLLNHMNDQGTVKPDSGCYNPIIDNLWKQGHLHEALRLFDSMVDRGIPPDVVVFSSLVNAFCKSSRWEEALEFLDVMVKWNISPDSYTFNTLLTRLCREDRFSEVFDLIENTSGGLNHDVVAYSLVISGLCRTGQWKKAVSLLDEVRTGDQALIPNGVTFNIIIDTLIKSGWTEDILSVFDSMVERNMTPDVVTYSTLLYGLGHADRWGEVSRLLDEMVSLRIFPDIVTMNGILDAYAEKGLMPKAQKQLREMIKYGPKPDAVTFTTMIKGFCRLGEIRKAREVFEQMESRGLKPSIISYNTLALGYMMVNRIAPAAELIEGVIQNGLVPNEVTLNIFKSIRAKKIVSYVD